MSGHSVSPSKPALTRRALGVFLALVLVGSLFVTPVSATEDPRFEATVSEPVQPGEPQTFTVIIRNDAEDVDDEVETASNVRVTAKSGPTPIEVISGERQLGRLADGESAAVDFRIEVPTNASGGTYHLPIEIVYEYEGDERERTTVTAAVEIPERPIFTIENVDVDLYPRETGVVTLSMSNVGSEPATDARLSLSSQNTPLTVGGVGSTSTFLGTLKPGATAEATFAVTATQAALAQAYDLTVQPTYQNTNGLTAQAPAQSIGVAPANEPRIAVGEPIGDVSPGEAGTVEMTFENRGEATLADAVLRLEPAGPDLTLDGGQTTTHYVGEWNPGETITVSTEIGASESVSVSEIPIRASLAFEHPAGIQSESGPVEVGIPVTAVDVFEYEDVSVTHTGPGAVVSATVTNAGDESVANAVVSLASTTPGVQVTDGSSFVGTLGPGESATVSAEVRVAGVDRAPQQFEAHVRYAGEDGQAARSEATTIWAEVATEGDLFAVEPVNNTFDVDSTNKLRVRITNEGTESFEDIRASLTAQPPYQSQSPTAYVASLDPGESTVVAFEVTTPDDGIGTVDALGLNLTAETATERTVLDGPHLVPVTVDGGGDATGSPVLIAGLAIVVIVLLGAGWWWLNR